jgi:DNA invertase Pin-like site-specific DNA recombinase
MTSAAIYARVSSARQAKDETIGSQLAALREHAAASRLDVPQEWVFADEGHSGATLVRPALEALRDLAAQGCLDVVLIYSPDRLARKFAYQALLIEELARCGARVEFVKGPRGDTPEDQLLVQFQGMFAEYEKAQLAERYRRGKAWRAKSGSVNVLSGAPFGYRYVRKTPESGARYELVPHEAALVAEMFRRYADEGAAIAGLRRWLTGQGVRTRTGKERWDRSVIWGMLRNPAYAGTAVFGKTRAVHEPAGLNRTARLAGRTVPRQVRVQDRPRGEWTAIPVPALVDEETSGRVQQRLEDNKRSRAATPGSRPCCRAWPPARPAATTAPPPPRPPGRRSTTTAAPAPTTTATPADGSAAASQSAPATPTPSSGTTSPACSPAPPSSAPKSARDPSGPARPTRSPASAASSSRPSPRPARRSARWSPRSPSSSSPSTSSEAACPASAPARPA